MRNVNVIVIALVSLFAIACAPHKQVVQVDPAFQADFESFKTDGASVGYGVEISDLKIEFGNPADNGCEVDASGILRGCCDSVESSHNKTPSILISKPIWDAMDRTNQKLLVYHEMGHCVLHRAHRNDLNKDNLAESIMQNGTKLAPYIAGFYENGAEHDYLMELFGKGPGPQSW